MHLTTKISQPCDILIGERTGIGENSYLICLEPTAQIKIGSNCTLTHSVQIYCLGSIIIEDSCMIAGNVFISDTTHSFDKIDIPYHSQGFNQAKPIVISEGAWIGQNSMIMPGCDIGRYSIVGANSVVLHSVPNYSIAVGAPARVVKKFSRAEERWIKVD